MTAGRDRLDAALRGSEKKFAPLLDTPRKSGSLDAAVVVQALEDVTSVVNRLRTKMRMGSLTRPDLAQAIADAAEVRDLLDRLDRIGRRVS